MSVSVFHFRSLHFSLPLLTGCLFPPLAFRIPERERDMTNIAHTLRSLRPEASALLMDNLGLASVGESPPQVLRRQSQQTCDAGILGHSGQCVPEATCGGALFPSGCSTGFECCFIGPCDVPQGNGYCKNQTRDTCNGEWYPGSPDDYPCQGDDTIICCVNYENMTNGSSTTTSSSSLPSATGINDDSSSSQNSSSDLTGSQIGGIVGGIVGAVLVTAFIVVGVFWWRRWKAKQAAAAAAAASDVGSPGTTDAGGGGGYNYHPLQEIQGKEYHQLESNGNERFEMDGHGAALQEMEGGSPVQAQREVAELPGCGVKAPR